MMIENQTEMLEFLRNQVHFGPRLCEYNGFNSFQVLFLSMLGIYLYVHSIFFQAQNPCAELIWCRDSLARINFVLGIPAENYFGAGIPCAELIWGGNSLRLINLVQGFPPAHN